MTDSADPEALAIGMLTLRADTPVGEWFKGKDQEAFFALWREAEAQPDGAEELVLSLLNLGWYALINLSALTGKPATEWIARIAQDARGSDAS